MNAKENYLETIRWGSPQYVPVYNEPIWYFFNLDSNSKAENWTDAWGIGWETQTKGIVPFPKKNPLSDINHLEQYQFPNPDDLFTDTGLAEKIASAKRSQLLVMGAYSYFLYERAWSLMGLENFMMALMTYPQEMHALLHRIAVYVRRVFERFIDLGVDAVTFSEDLGTQRSLMIAPDMFREFLLPEYKFCFEDLLREKKIINFHSCGCIQEAAGDLASIGVTILNPIQARCNDLPQLKKDTHKRMVLNGAIDTHMIMTGTPEQIRKEVLRVMEILKPGGGYICGPDQYFPDMPAANLDALVQTAKEAGKY